MTIVKSSIFKVLDEPYCVWEPELEETNRRFLKGLDPEYFAYLIEAHTSAADRKRAAVALRLASHHGLETLFSLLGALIQAPDCVYAWLAECSTGQLRTLTRRISEEDQLLFCKLNIATINWHCVSGAVFSSLVAESNVKERVVGQFASLWHDLADELNTPIHIEEYNSLKHGFRVGTGGFGLSIGPPSIDGSFPLDSEFKLIGQSDLGASYLQTIPVSAKKGERARKVGSVFTNWSFDQLVRLNEAIYWSIKNTVTALRRMNGIESETLTFVIPDDPNHFSVVWKNGSGILNMRHDSIVPEDEKFSRSRSALNDLLGLAQRRNRMADKP